MTIHTCRLEAIFFDPLLEIDTTQDINMELQKIKQHLTSLHDMTLRRLRAYWRCALSERRGRRSTPWLWISRSCSPKFPAGNFHRYSCPSYTECLRHPTRFLYSILLHSVHESLENDQHSKISNYMYQVQQDYFLQAPNVNMLLTSKRKKCDQNLQFHPDICCRPRY